MSNSMVNASESTKRLKKQIIPILSSGSYWTIEQLTNAAGASSQQVAQCLEQMEREGQVVKERFSEGIKYKLGINEEQLSKDFGGSLQLQNRIVPEKQPEGQIGLQSQIQNQQQQSVLWSVDGGQQTYQLPADSQGDVASYSGNWLVPQNDQGFAHTQVPQQVREAKQNYSELDNQYPSEGQKQVETAATNIDGTKGNQDTVTSGEEQKPCPYFMKTGTCAFGDRCVFKHPLSRPVAQLNSRGFPMRQGEETCSFYQKHGMCGFGTTCKYHHPELPPMVSPYPHVAPVGQPMYAPWPQQYQYPPVMVPQYMRPQQQMGYVMMMPYPAPAQRPMLPQATPNVGRTPRLPGYQPQQHGGDQRQPQQGQPLNSARGKDRQ